MFVKGDVFFKKVQGLTKMKHDILVFVRLLISFVLAINVIDFAQ